MIVAVHNPVNGSWREREREEKKKENALSSFTIYKYMYVLHLTEVLPIDGVGAALRPCGCLREKL